MGEPLRRIDPRSLAAEALAGGGSIRLAFVLQRLLTVAELRDLARKHGATVKGFRIERAPADRLATVIAESEGPLLDDACERLVDAASAGAAVPAGDAEAPARVERDQLRELGRLRRELSEAWRELERSREQGARSRGLVDELRQDLDRERAERAVSVSRLKALERELQQARSGVTAPPGDDARRVHELERDLESLTAAEAELRRRLAERESLLRDTERQVTELEAELDEVAPKRRGRRRPRPAPVDDEDRRLRVPHFSEAFMKSLASKERRSVETAFRSVFLLCTEGPAYGGLEVKKIEGQDLWSMRAGIKVRVYFRHREDGDIDIVELSDREDQDTMLRRLKER